MASKRPARPEAKLHRLFIAIPIPDEAARAVQAAIEPWQTVLPEVRWVPRENWHVTVWFLGPTDPRLVSWVRERLAQVAVTTAPFDTRISGVGAFGSLHRARVLWVGIDDAEEQMAALAAAIQDSLSSDLAPEGRPFMPHVTVGRSDPPVALPEPFGATPLESKHFRVEALVLMRSHLRRLAPVYEPIEVYPMLSQI